MRLVERCLEMLRVLFLVLVEAQEMRILLNEMKVMVNEEKLEVEILKEER
jgi:hypothetical protein